jgi:hypothetical protein
LGWRACGGKNRKVEQPLEVNGGRLKSLPLFYVRGWGKIPLYPPFMKGEVRYLVIASKAKQCRRFREIAADFVLATFGIASSLVLLAMTE